LEGDQSVNAERYLARIGAEKTSPRADLVWLKLLQRQHLLNVPFENLDIHWKRPILLDTGAFYRKIVEENRGGFCYELNGLFNELLRELGFETRLLSARVSDGQGNFSPEYDHAAILVDLGEIQYIADVGFGSFSVEPLKLETDVEQTDAAGIFLVRRYDDETFEIAKKEDLGWRTEYIFTPLGHDLPEFEERCRWHQTSPDSHFMKNKICSLLTVTGRKTLTDSKYIVTTETGKVGVPVLSSEEFDQILLKEFGINMTSVAPALSLADQYIR
jgi:N-hydroxyarylamine O-acetyltransferase